MTEEGWEKNPLGHILLISIGVSTGGLIGATNYGLSGTAVGAVLGIVAMYFVLIVGELSQRGTEKVIEGKRELQEILSKNR